jgi:hypothetical protein
MSLPKIFEPDEKADSTITALVMEMSKNKNQFLRNKSQKNIGNDSLTTSNGNIPAQSIVRDGSNLTILEE